MSNQPGAVHRRALVVILSSALLAGAPALAEASSSARAAAAEPTLTVSKARTAPDGVVTLTGRLPTSTGRPVELQLRSGATWVTQDSTQASGTGTFSFAGSAPALVAQVRTYRVLAPKLGTTPARVTPSRTVSAVSPFRLVSPRTERESASQVAPDGGYVLYATGTGTRSWHLLKTSTGKVRAVSHAFDDRGTEYDDSAAYFDWSTMTFRRVVFGAFAAERAKDPALVTDTVITDATPDGRFALGYSTLFRRDGRVIVPVRRASYLYDRRAHAATALPTAGSTDSKAEAISDSGRFVVMHETDVVRDSAGTIERARTEALWFDRRQETTVPIVSFAIQAPEDTTPIETGRWLNGLAISGDGQTVLFNSADDLTAGHGGLFRWRHTGQQVSRIDGRAGDFDRPSLSTTGRVITYVALPSGAGGRIAWRLDTLTGVRHQVIRALDGKAPNGTSRAASVSMSEDGRFVAFLVQASNLVPATKGRSTSVGRVFLYDDRI